MFEGWRIEKIEGRRGSRDSERFVGELVLAEELENGTAITA